jgi:gamma-glutamyltranspeptidase/glutathione hydrolase
LIVSSFVTRLSELQHFRHGVVVAAHPLAARAGVAVLKKGGNAVDAAVATALTLGAATPAFCGIGGGGFALLWLAKEEKAVFVDYRERAPASATGDMFQVTAKGNVVRNENSVGYRAVGVPGTLAGDSLLIENYGNLSLQDVVRSGAMHASKGYSVSRGLAEVWKKSESKLRRFKSSREVYLKRARPYRKGERIVLKDLADTLRTIIRRGISEFYTGEIAGKIVRDVQAGGGLVSAADLERFHPTLREPVHGRFKDLEIISAPPPSAGGIIILQTLKMLENIDQKLKHNSPETLHFMSEALMRANTSTALVCDPDFSSVPVGALVSDEHCSRLSSSIPPDRASVTIPVTDISQHLNSCTSHLSVIDSEGNVAALTESVECYFGSGVVVSDTGVLLNDTMHDFDPRPGRLNSVGPGKVPMSSMSPTIVLKDGKPLIVAGSAGGPRIPSSTLQVLLNVTEFGIPIEDAVAAPRIHVKDNLVQAEGRIAPKTIEALRKMGHRVQTRRSMEMYFGGVHAASSNHETGELEGGADPRRDGAAAGF